MVDVRIQDLAPGAPALIDVYAFEADTGGITQKGTVQSIVDLVETPASAPAVTVDAADKIMAADVSDSDSLIGTTVQDVADFATNPSTATPGTVDAADKIMVADTSAGDALISTTAQDVADFAPNPSTATPGTMAVADKLILADASAGDALFSGTVQDVIDLVPGGGSSFNPDNTVYISSTGNDSWAGNADSPLLTFQACVNYIDTNYASVGTIVDLTESSYLIPATVELGNIKVFAPMATIKAATGVLAFTCLASPTLVPACFIAKSVESDDPADAAFIEVQDSVVGETNFKMEFDIAIMSSDTGSLVRVLDANNPVNVYFDACGMASGTGASRVFRTTNAKSFVRGNIGRLEGCDITRRDIPDSLGVRGFYGNIPWTGGVELLTDGANVQLPLDEANLLLYMTSIGTREIDNPDIFAYTSAFTFVIEMQQPDPPVELMTFGSAFKFQGDQIFTPTLVVGARDKIVCTINYNRSRIDCLIIYDYPFS
jgi:hypothetical protein